MREKSRAATQVQNTIVGEWTETRHLSDKNFVIQKIGNKFDVRWVNMGLGYKITAATEKEFSYQLDQGLQQTYGTCMLSIDGQSLNCRARIVQNFPGGSSGEVDPWSYRRVR